MGKSRIIHLFIIILVFISPIKYLFSENTVANGPDPVYSGPRQGKKIALTLDDGYNPNPALIEFIEAEGIRGTAFILGDAADRDPEFVKKIKSLGWEVCIHTDTHPFLTKLEDSEIVKEIKVSREKLTALAGEQPFWFRPPYGDYDSRVRRIAASEGFRLVLWSVSFCDSSLKVKTEAQIEWVLDRIHPEGGDILMGHWGGVNTFDVFKVIYPELKKTGYTFCTVTELLTGDE